MCVMALETCVQDTDSETVMSWYFENDQKTSEDCLFLDVYVPGKVVRGEASDLPVLNWIYSGGYGKLLVHKTPLCNR